MKKFNVKKYVGSKYSHSGNLYKFVGLERVDVYEPPYVICEGIDTNKFFMIPPERFDAWHNQYVVKA